MRPADLLLRLGLACVLVLCLTAGDCFDPDEHLPTAPATQDALRVSLSTSSIPADGTSTLVVTAEIDPRAEGDNRLLEFKTSGGRFMEATADPFRTVERGVDAAGRASATLRSSRTVGTVELTVTVKGAPAVFVRTSVEFVRAEASETIAFVDLPANAPADDTTLTPITVRIDEGITSDRRTVTFTTSRGTFADSSSGNATAPAGADHRARVDLESPLEPGMARLTAAVDGVVVDAGLLFVAALPETILVSPTNVVLEATNDAEGTTPVRVQLLRETGKVSPTTVRARLVTDPAGDELPALIRDLVPSDADGKLTFTLTVGSVTYLGPAVVEVRVDGSPTVGRARVEIIAPSG